MPGNEVEDGIRNIYQLDNSSWGQHLSQAVGGSWPSLDYDQWVGKQARIGTPPIFNLKNYSLQQLASAKGSVSESPHVPFSENHRHLSPRPEYSRSLTLDNPLNTNEFLLGCQDFLSDPCQPEIFGENSCYDKELLNSRGFPILKSQHENDCADSPTLTTNSERSEITEASSDFNFLRGQQQFVRDRELSAHQNHPMQQPGYNDMQLLQQHVMFKQLQEFQRQQQLQQLGDLRPQNSLGQFSAISRQAPGGQFSPLINGTPVHDASQMLRNWMQRGASPAAQGVPNKVVFSQEQAQALRSMGLTQQLDVSLYGTPISNTRGTPSQYPQLQGLPHDSINLLTKGGQVQKSMMQSSGFGNPYLGDQPAVPNLVGLSQGALASKQELQMKNNFGQFPVQDLNNGVFPGNLQEGNTPQVNTSVKEFSGRHEQAVWPAMQQEKQLGPSQGMVPLDPIEAKILYNMDGNIWDAFGSRAEASTGGLGNMLEHPDSSYAFPSIQSGSWSALMQSAVAEASSSDTGLQEEWSGLTFQNTEHSTDNQISNFVDSDKQQSGWVDNNLQSTSSFSSKPFSMITDSSLSSSFPGFQQPGIQLPVEQREDICQDGSHELAGNCNAQQKPSVEHGQKVQTLVHSDNAWAGQMFEHSHASHNQKGSSSDISLDKGNNNMAKSQRQMNNGPHVALNSYEGANETHELQQKYQQRENSNDCSRAPKSHEEEHIEQFRFFGNVSSNAMSVDKASVPDFHGSSRASNEVPFRVDHGSNASTAFHGSLLPDDSNLTTQTSEHMLELLHKVDRSKDASTLKQFGSRDCNPLAEVPGADTGDTSVTQMYAQSSASQGFGLRLAPPSQRLASSNSFSTPLGFHQTMNNLNSRQVNPELGGKNQAWLSPSSFPSSPPNELAQRTHWDNKSGSVGQTSYSPYLNVQGNSGLPFSPNFTQTRNQLQLPSVSNVPVNSQSLQAALPGNTTRSPFNQASLQTLSQQVDSNVDNQQFPVLDASPKSQPPNMPGMSQQGENLTRPYNVWRNVPTQRPSSGVEPLKFSDSPSSMVPPNASMIITSQAPHGSHDQNFIKDGYKSLEVGGSSNSLGLDHREEHLGKEQQRIPSKAVDPSLSGGVSQGQEPVSDATALPTSLLASHTQQQEQDLDKARHGNNMARTSDEKNLDSISHSHNEHNNYSLLNQVRAINSGAESASDVQRAMAFGGLKVHDNFSRFRHSMDGGPSSALLPNSFPSGDGEMLNFPAEAREGVTVKAPSQTALQSRPSHEMVRFGYTDSHAQSSSSSVLPNHSGHGHVNVQMAHSWFKQYGALRNGQMAQVFDSRLAAAAALQLSQGKSSQNLHIHRTLDRLDTADAGQGDRIWSSTAAAFVAGQQLSSSSMMPSDGANQVVIMRPKKRKIITSDLPWHKEVTQDPQGLQNISVAEQDWAQATNRLFEKVEDEVEVVEDLHPVHRSKRRLILTTQLVQQLFRPAPVSIFSADCVLNYGTISYFVSRLSLGDACSFAYCRRNDFCKPVNDDNMNTEKLKIPERSDDQQQLLKVVEELTSRAKKLDSDVQRLDKTASIVDIRSELQELERFAIINRFAKFHVRGQADATGTSSTSSSSPGTMKPIPQRHVMAFPMPRNLPEGVQCFSL